MFYPQRREAAISELVRRQVQAGDTELKTSTTLALIRAIRLGRADQIGLYFRAVPLDLRMPELKVFLLETLRESRDPLIVRFVADRLGNQTLTPEERRAILEKSRTIDKDLQADTGHGPKLREWLLSAVASTGPDSYDLIKSYIEDEEYIGPIRDVIPAVLASTASTQGAADLFQMIENADWTRHSDADVVFSCLCGSLRRQEERARKESSASELNRVRADWRKLFTKAQAIYAQPTTHRDVKAAVLLGLAQARDPEIRNFVQSRKTDITDENKAQTLENVMRNVVAD
jgi:hypothetical protein